MNIKLTVTDYWGLNNEWPPYDMVDIVEIKVP